MEPFVICKITRTMEMTDCLEEPTDITLVILNVLVSECIYDFFIARWFVLFSKIIEIRTDKIEVQSR